MKKKVYNAGDYVRYLGCSADTKDSWWINYHDKIMQVHKTTWKDDFIYPVAQPEYSRHYGNFESATVADYMIQEGLSPDNEDIKKLYNLLTLYKAQENSADFFYVEIDYIEAAIKKLIAGLELSYGEKKYYNTLYKDIKEYKRTIAEPIEA